MNAYIVHLQWADGIGTLNLGVYATEAVAAISAYRSAWRLPDVGVSVNCWNIPIESLERVLELIRIGEAQSVQVLSLSLQQPDPAESAQ